MLDRNGNGVSDITINKKENEIKITHKDRYFDLKMDSIKSFNEWMSAFSALGLYIKYENDDDENCMSETSFLQRKKFKSQIVKFDTLNNSEQNEEEYHLNDNIKYNNNNNNNCGSHGSLSLSTSPTDKLNDNKYNKLNEMEMEINDNNHIEKEESNEYDEEDQRLLKEQEKLMKLLKNDQNKILEEFTNLQKAIITNKET